LSDALLKPFATDLFASKPISRLMSDDFVAVERGQSLQQVSRLLTSRRNSASKKISSSPRAAATWGWGG
jgi:predicted transcriptional regulator